MVEIEGEWNVLVSMVTREDWNVLVSMLTIEGE